MSERPMSNESVTDAIKGLGFEYGTGGFEKILLDGKEFSADEVRAALRSKPVTSGADVDSLRIAKQFADQYHSGASGSEMDCDSAMALALAIDDILSAPEPATAPVVCCRRRAGRATAERTT